MLTYTNMKNCAACCCCGYYSDIHDDSVSVEISPDMINLSMETMKEVCLVVYNTETHVSTNYKLACEDDERYNGYVTHAERANGYVVLINFQKRHAMILPEEEIYQTLDSSEPSHEIKAPSRPPGGLGDPAIDATSVPGTVLETH